MSGGRASLATVLRALFGFGGSVGRAVYGLGVLFVLLVLAAVVRATLLAPEDSDAYWIMGLVFIVTGVAGCWSVAVLSVKRLRDLGLPPVLVVIGLFPAIAWIGMLFLATAPGRSNKRDAADD